MFADVTLTGAVSTQFAQLAAGELCRRCTHRKLYHFKTFVSPEKSQGVFTLLSQMSDILSQHHA